MIETNWRGSGRKRVAIAMAVDCPGGLPIRVPRVGLLLIYLAAGCGGAPAPETPPSGAESDEAGPMSAMTRLATEETEAGWQLLSASLDGWRGYMSDAVPGGWAVDEGLLTFTPGGEGGDLITRDQFDDFELALEWRVESRGNSGIFYRVVEEGRYAYWTGPEMQILDNEGHPDGASPLTSAGANYGLHAPPEDVTRPVGEWNEARVVVRGSDVEHWLNGTRVVAYTLGSPEWRALVAESKFSQWPGYGEAPRGHLGLQDHGDPVWFRNVRVRSLEPR
ncbi:MAG: DUF1080 domain-containing protein [Gemmatimonadetes bacterium]|nr:DUF1080 domain-containing protein [Gemmatimonadota bacterium]